MKAVLVSFTTLLSNLFSFLLNFRSYKKKD
ncbi:hypothetical protein rpr22_CDSx885 [Rickettsia prowazekii str. Rp22]|uniref:Uncharacterized protein n=1 Tax=Rickettsia prowazekii (strain Rp22) TaxID=449216 RepID=D5AY82_RICPP|nr:hypothetical protein rpr22_CDSx885 [Rickettsia prowazekii str. Rp22]